MEAQAERDRELAQVDAELARARVIPARQLGETDGDYTAALIRRSIEEQRDLAAVTASVADVSLALATEDVTTLEALAVEALQDGHPERVRRVARAVEMTLGRLAVAEMQRKSAPGAPRPAAEAAQRVGASLREWRAREAEKSPAVRRQRITARYETRRNDARRAVATAAQQFGLREAVEQGLVGAQKFNGISEAVAAQFSESELARLFGPEAYRGEVRVRYQRQNGDLTSPLPSSRHLAYVAKGWTAVEVVEEPVPATERRAVLSSEMAEHARHDRIGIWERDGREIAQSCRQAPRLLRDGWAFVRLASERELYLDSRCGRQPSAEEAARAATLAHDRP